MTERTTSRESGRPAGRPGRWFLPGRWQCIARGSVGSPPLIGTWATAITAVAIRRCGQVVGLAEWHMLPSWLPPTYVPECLLLACWGLGLATLWPLCSSQLRRPVTDVEPQRRFGPLRRILAVRTGSPRRISATVQTGSKSPCACSGHTGGYRCHPTERGVPVS